MILRIEKQGESKMISIIRKTFVSTNINSLIRGMLGAILFAGITALSAQARFYLPFTPVPITLQTFVVLLSGLMLGSLWGMGAQIIYLFAGTFVFSLFSVNNPGIMAIFGPTGGYLIGFIMAAFLAGKLKNMKLSYIRTIALLAIINFTCIYIPGIIQLGIFTNMLSSMPKLFTLLQMAFFPFIAGDIIKIIIASSFIWAIKKSSIDL